jgi:ribosome biogenesis GTPase
VSPRILGAKGSSYEDDDYTDEDLQAFDRPLRHTRPKTKDRPDYSQALSGQVMAVDRGRYLVRLADGTEIKAMKARQIGRKGVIVGDLVKLVGDVSGKEDSLARIAEVEPRTTMLRRSADDDDPTERPIVANADQLVIVTALADPPPRIGMIDRLLLAAYDARIAPILCLTKADIADPREVSENFSGLELTIIATQPESDLSELEVVLQNHTSVFVGHSGVGKSTLINALIPGANRKIGIVNEVTGRGRHTSTSSIALELPQGGLVIDTPGVRSFGLSHIGEDSLEEIFPDSDTFDDARKSSLERIKSALRAK